LMVLAFALGSVCDEIGTGPHVAQLALAMLHPALVIPLVFLIASMASACDLIDHVNTQLPYALASAGIALGLYLMIGFLG